MTDHIQCPACGRSFQDIHASGAGREVRCLFCGARIPVAAGERSIRRPSAPGVSGHTKLLVGGLVGCGVLVAVCAGVVIWGVVRLLGPTSFPEQTEDYAEARQHFRTKLVRQGPAPQRGRHERPPDGVVEMEYVSGDLHLKAWVSGPPGDGRRRPSVLFLHGGFAFGADDWEQAQPFRAAGFVVMTPWLRGENGLPGSYSMFYDEVDDVLAAAEAMARLPYVDGQRLYVAGHSVGGTLALLATQTSNRFRAAASFSGSPDQVVWSRGQAELVPFDRSDPREFQMRSPLAFPRSFKCPVRLYYGEGEPRALFAAPSQKTADLARAAGLDVEAVSVPGDHLTAVAPAMPQAIAFFQEK
jgi:dienelactone hydrolase